ncbi:MAG: Trk system potassium transporter TrkA [Halobacteriaceae archaeon]
MRVVIVGAGEVGSSIAESLAADHEVVVVDVDAERVDSLNYSLDVLAITGDGTDLDVLAEAGIGDADILIASTDNDETNLATCGTAATVSEAFTIARVKSTNYLDTWEHSRGAFGADFMVCTDLLTAQAIVRLISLPTARDVDPFAGGRIQMAEFEVPETSPITGQTVSEADRFDELTFVAIVCDDEVEIARGETVIEAGNRVVIIGSPESVRSFAMAVTTETPDVEDVVVVGGSTIGRLVAELLERRGFSPRLIERDPERARALAEDLSGSRVIEHDATDQTFLERERVGDADMVVAAVGADERCLLVCLLAKQLGADRAVAVVEEHEYVDVFEAVGVDVAVNPRVVTAEEITRFTREERAENVAIIASDRAEVLEIEVDADSVLAGRPIREAVADLPEGVVVGALTRDGEFITPRGNTVIETGDHVVVFVREDVREEVTSKL